MNCSCCRGGRGPRGHRDPAGGSVATRRGALGLGLGGAAGLALGGCAGVGGGLGGIGASLVPDEQAQALGTKAFEEIRAKTPVARDPALQAIVERVGRRILAVADPEVPPDRWNFVVFDGKEANAFALPGGHVGVYTGMFRVARNEAQLAAVIGHEIGHVTAEHAQQRMGASALTDLGTGLLGTALEIGGVSGGQQLAGLLGVGAQYGVILPFSRGQELEADRLGVNYMARSGYDPAEAVEFWRRMTATSGRGGGGPEFLSTHPSDTSRIAQLERLMPDAERVYRSRVG